MTSAHDGAFCGQTRWTGCEYVSTMRRDMAPLLAIMLFKPCVPNVVLHVQPQPAKPAGRGACASKRRDRCGCRVKALVRYQKMLPTPQPFTE